MLATEVLKEEHKAIKTALNILERLCDKLEKGEDIKIEDIEKIIEFIRVFADKCHHGKEEGLLFPVLEKAGIPKEDGPIGVMLYEHEMGRKFIREIAEGVERFKNGDKEAAKLIVENARDYISLMREHIFKEDNILFAMADAHLSEAQQEELAKRFETFEEEEIGKGKHEELHQLLHSLMEVYLHD